VKMKTQTHDANIAPAQRPPLSSSRVSTAEGLLQANIFTHNLLRAAKPWMADGTVWKSLPSRSLR